MKIRYLLTAAIALVSTTVFAEDYKICHFSAGMKTDCAEPFTGKTVIFDQGSYKICHFSAGMKTDCAEPFTGKAAILNQN
ncbi:hypothetical protein ZMO1_ZMOp36x019 (plasmid) [Zymomonas mobilis subsp. mobilis ZM4 = ATCC 31821]|uniref:hypothetical protein n=1 Tax=Zymomonas mobilis TaxID=542 RepID=UPI0007854385|nr:hypothetical protein [Zymomonas mobilis]AVZ26876.1 hypothetical protein ZMO2_ZMOp36x019 [Zymomonas mobilis subsp. mobilis]AVZ28797.1 hypothetical protein ZMO3_ZMOp41x019 [Zymomonas mobilis subsp. mobilis]AVZ43208.1 hypothetical protein ZMO1_ZMOp36x019 [Zymomonas mobilis subsp. mobilis ZM4 = ATCC 31821]UBQ08688.1 hypothetical protein LB319_09455 [Zymomonas mobilis]